MLKTDRADSVYEVFWNLGQVCIKSAGRYVWRWLDLNDI